MKTLLRWLKFNLIGVVGAGVQLFLLAMLIRGGMNYLSASALGVEAALLHNFAWHQRYTWVDRRAHNVCVVLARLARFHLLNGAVSIIGNLLVMRWLVGTLRMPALPANFSAILACSLVNFLLGDRFVFRNDTCRA